MATPAVDDCAYIRAALYRIIAERNSHRACQMRTMHAEGQAAHSLGCWCRAVGLAGMVIQCPPVPSVESSAAEEPEAFHLPAQTVVPWFPRS